MEGESLEEEEEEEEEEYLLRRLGELRPEDGALALE
jgi:hypothetical protein